MIVGMNFITKPRANELTTTVPYKRVKVLLKVGSCCVAMVSWFPGCWSVGQIQDTYAGDSQAPILHEDVCISQGIPVMAGKGDGASLHAGPHYRSHSAPFNMFPP